MEFKVPQNIDMEDRIIGPLTLNQFFYLLFGGLIIYILFNKLVLNGLSFLFWILAIPVGALSFALAFVKIQDRPFPVFFVAMIRYISQPRARVWQHYTPPKQYQPAKQTKKADQVPKKTLDPIRVKEIASILDKPEAKH